MKTLIFSFILLVSSLALQAQSAGTKSSDNAGTRKQVVEASCGECQFGLKGKTCDLAVRINGKAYFVDGTNIDDHGDAHASDGFCEKIRKAEVIGKVIKGRFQASYFKLLPAQPSKSTPRR